MLSYTPSHHDLETLARLTIGQSRLRLVDTLVEAVRSDSGGCPRHHLVLGPRGSGKTHLLSLVVRKLRERDLNSAVFPVVLAEEEVASKPADLLLRILQRLAEQLVCSPQIDQEKAIEVRVRCLEQLDRIQGEANHEVALAAAFAALEVAATALDRLLVVVVENLVSLLYSGPALSRQETVKAQWGFREALEGARRLLLLAAAPTLFGEMSDPRAAFHGVFCCHTIGELSGDEMMAVIQARIDVELAAGRLEPGHLLAVQADFTANRAQLRGLFALTGGIVRYAHLIFDLMLEADLGSIGTMLARFLDRQTPYFQPCLDPRLVPEAELEVLDVLATADGPRSPIEIARRLRGRSTSAAATLLRRLQDRGLVRRKGEKRSEVRYDVVEPLYRVWRCFRVGRGDQNRMVVLAQLVAAILTPVELGGRQQTLTGTEASALRVRLLQSALARPFSPSNESARVVAFGRGQPRSQDYAAKLAAATGEAQTGSLRRGWEISSEAIGEIRALGNRLELSRCLGRHAHLAYLAGELDEALAAAQEGEGLARMLAEDGALARCLQSRGDVLLHLGRSREAQQAYVTAEGLFTKAGHELGRANCVRSRGEVLFQLGHTDQALKTYEAAAERFSSADHELGRGDCIRSRGEILLQLDRCEEALEAFTEAVTLYTKVRHDLGLGNALFGLGSALLRSGRGCEALDSFQEAEQLFSRVGDELGRANCLAGRGQLACTVGVWSLGLQLLIEAQGLAESTGHRFNSDLFSSWCLYGMGRALQDMDRPAADDLLPRVSRLAAGAGASDAVRVGTVHLAIQLVAVLGPDEAPARLAHLESELPPSHAELLRPVRLAVGVLAGTLPATLPEESVEVCRAVAHVLAVSG